MCSDPKISHNQALLRVYSWWAVNVLTKVNIKKCLAQNSLLGFVFFPKPIFAIKKFRIWAVNTLTAEGIYKISRFWAKK